MRVVVGSSWSLPTISEIHQTYFPQQRYTMFFKRYTSNICEIFLYLLLLNPHPFPTNKLGLGVYLPSPCSTLHYKPSYRKRYQVASGPKCFYFTHEFPSSLRKMDSFIEGWKFQFSNIHVLYLYTFILAYVTSLFVFIF